MLVIIPDYVTAEIDRMFIAGGFPAESECQFKKALLNYLDLNGVLPELGQILVKGVPAAKPNKGSRHATG